MAINTQKYLPSSKGGTLAKVAKISKGSVAVISEKSQKNISIIRVKVIEIEKKKDDEVNKNVKKIPSESLKNYKAGDKVVSKNDGNTYEVVMYKNQKRWKILDE